MSRTPFIRRLVAIAPASRRALVTASLAAVIPFGAAASSAHAATQPADSPIVVSAPDDGSGSPGFVFGCFRSSWS